MILYIDLFAFRNCILFCIMSYDKFVFLHCFYFFCLYFCFDDNNKQNCNVIYDVHNLFKNHFNGERKKVTTDSLCKKGRFFVTFC